MICKQCGFDFEGNFCSNCGAKANTPTESRTAIPPLRESFLVDIEGVKVDANLVIRAYGLGLRKTGAYYFVSRTIGVSREVVQHALEPIMDHHIQHGEKAGILDGSLAQTELNAWAKQQKKCQHEHHQKQNNESKPETYVNMKICLNCGDKLLAKAIKCPTCGSKLLKGIDKADTAEIERIQQSAPVKKTSIQPKWMSTSVITAAPCETKTRPVSARQRIKENKRNAVACCPKCGSTSLSANKKGFGIGKAVIGAGLTSSPLGLIAGNINARKVWVTCLNCGKRWKL